MIGMTTVRCMRLDRLPAADEREEDAHEHWILFHISIVGVVRMHVWCTDSMCSVEEKCSDFNGEIDNHRVSHSDVRATEALTCSFHGAPTQYVQVQPAVPLAWHAGRRLNVFIQIRECLA